MILLYRLKYLILLITFGIHPRDRCAGFWLWYCDEKLKKIRSFY